MEPAPLSDADLDSGPGMIRHPSVPPTSERLAANIPFALDIDLVEETDEAGALPAVEVEEIESVPALRRITARRSGIWVSPSRLVVLGALAFSAGILTSAGARTLVKLPRSVPAPVAVTAPVLGVDRPTATTTPESSAAGTTSVAGNLTPGVNVTSTPEPGTTVTAGPMAANLPPIAAVVEPQGKAPVAARERTREKAATRSRASRRAQAQSGAAAMSASAAAEPNRAHKTADGHAERDPATWVDPFAQ